MNNESTHVTRTAGKHLLTKISPHASSEIQTNASYCLVRIACSVLAALRLEMRLTYGVSFEKSKTCDCEIFLLEGSKYFAS